MKIFVVDRIVQDVVVLEDECKEMCQVALSQLPKDISAGDVVTWDGNVYVRDPDQTARRRAAAFSLEQKLKNKFCR